MDKRKAELLCAIEKRRVKKLVQALRKTKQKDLSEINPQRVDDKRAEAKKL